VLRTASQGRGLALLTAAVVSILLLTPSTAAAQDGEEHFDDNDKSLREQLDEAATAYQDARVELEKSEKRELKITVRLEALEKELAEVTEEARVVAATAYRTGRVGPFVALLNSTSPDSFLERAVTVDMIAKHEQEILKNLTRLRTEIEAERKAIQIEIEVQEREVAKLEEAKKKAEAALRAVGGGSTGEFVAYDAPAAKPAPRNADGSWPAESCTEDDPTTGGCLTPRMLHAYNEAQLFGFDRYTSCYRSGTWGEHPLGRACDFATSYSGFGGVAYGEEKVYGDKLASFFVANADALGVLYVIWYREIWFPGSGWRTYGSAGGDPASDHTNHVHVSIR